jgi:uracil-DNA glycosylase family protein
MDRADKFTILTNDDASRRLSASACVAGGRALQVCTFGQWRAAARDLLLHHVPPRSVQWRSCAPGFGAPDGVAPPADGSCIAPPADGSGVDAGGTMPCEGGESARVGGVTQAHAGSALCLPRSLLELLREAACCRMPERWALLYLVLWRWQLGQHAVIERADPDGARLHAMVDAVRLDETAMHAAIRFRERPATAGAPRFVAWCEPTHDVLDRLAQHFVRRMGLVTWMIATPEASVLWDGVTLRDMGPPLRGPIKRAAEALGAGLGPVRAPDQASAIRARLAIGDADAAAAVDAAVAAESAADAEADADAEVAAKSAADATVDAEVAASADASADAAADAEAVWLTYYRGRFKPNGRTGPSGAANAGDGAQARVGARAPFDIARLPQSPRAPPATLAQCRRCELWRHASAAVDGSGPQRASLMLVGEQPNDQEDRLGVAFAGACGKLLERALAAAGLRRDEVYLTNAVKHFKWEARGKRRLHKGPTQDEIEACGHWLRQELAAVRPKVVVALGATALKALSGDRHASVGAARQRPFEHGGRWIVAAYHPSYVLRIPDRAARERTFDDLVDALRAAQALLKQP